MNIWLLSILGIVGLIVGTFIFKKMTRKEDSLDLRLGGIKNKFNDCCKRIFGKSGG